jgi:hypothetical protein
MTDGQGSDYRRLSRCAFLSGSAAVTGALLLPAEAGTHVLAAARSYLAGRQRAATGSAIITTVAGGGSIGSGGPATSAALSSPFSLSVDAANNLYICDNYYHRVHKVDAVTGILTTVAGSGVPGFSGDCGPAVNA